ncbi:hypothetical protein CJ030_MR5G023526 [Morella rubra]|uniref:Uncharacterized protein n=1 Tax=Morella rubra TaxID=262757 RepID=A0A6A1VI56_9ROSI|nr:hypothetical protein CJ030_MR5G023526 [Morella rubra]
MLPTTAEVFPVISVHKSYSDVLCSSVRGTARKQGVSGRGQFKKSVMTSTKNKNCTPRTSSCTSSALSTETSAQKKSCTSVSTQNLSVTRADEEIPGTRRAGRGSAPRTIAGQNQRASQDALWPLAAPSGTPFASPRSSLDQRLPTLGMTIPSRF